MKSISNFQHSGTLNCIEGDFPMEEINSKDFYNEEPSPKLPCNKLQLLKQKKNKITPFENRISFEKNDKDITFDIFLKKEMDFQMKLERNLQDLNEVEEFRPLEMDETRTPTLKKV